MWEFALVFGKRPWTELCLWEHMEGGVLLKRKGRQVKPARGPDGILEKSEALSVSVSITATKQGFI